MTYIVASLYKFVALPDYRALREPLLDLCREQGLRGTLLLAAEGINGTLSGSRAGLDTVLAWLRADERLADLESRESRHDARPFRRMKVKLKREIVTMGVPAVDPNRRVGAYVEPARWNALLADPELTLIDTRNHYECAIGSFTDAIDPQIANFREFPAWARHNLDPLRDRKLALFCTGGIRCEKATSYLLEQGFAEVYHLRGGILKYLEETPRSASRWQGECFVFDERVALNHALQQGSYAQCFACRHPLSAADRASPHYRKGVTCPHCVERGSEQRRARCAERQRQVELAGARGEAHIGE